MNIQKITDASFRRYGRIVTGIDFSGLIQKMQDTPLPDGVVYEPGTELLESLPVYGQVQKIIYGELPIQIGYCNGHNYLLNAVEYHRSSEINVAATDAVLLLGWQPEVTDDYTYDTSKIEAFLLPRGTAVELYATTLHYAPCSVDGNGFRVSVILPKGTNLPLEEGHKGGEDALLTAKNKWLIGHAEGGLDADVHIGLLGKNVDIRD